MSNDHVSFYVPVTFNEPVDLANSLVVNNGLTVTGPSVFGNITASNILYEIKAGSGISLDSSKQTPTISNSGVLSLGGKTGAVTLEAGSGITIDGTKITNKDLGTSVMTFKTYSVSGQRRVYPVY